MIGKFLSFHYYQKRLERLKLMHNNRLYILSEKHYDFIKKLVDKISSGMINNRKYRSCVFLNFSKAFGTIYHDILIRNVNAMV